MTSIIGLNIRSGGLITAAIICILFAGCANQPAKVPITTPVLKNTEPMPIQEQDVLVVSEEMKQFLDRYVNSQVSQLQKLRALTRAVSHPGILGFNYDVNQTLTAHQAFNKRTGNCLAFANMFIALARESGLKAYYQEAQTLPQWEEQGSVYIIAKHINVLVRLRSGDYVVDVGQNRAARNVNVGLISDSYAKAQYFNNFGVDALLADQLSQAHGYFVHALDVEPRSYYIWSNLGVTYNRNGQPEDAQWAYRQAIRVNHSAYVAMSNLSTLIQQQGNQEEARLLQKKAEHHRRNNPYYLLMLSDKALAEKRYSDSLKLLRSALRKKKNEHRLHFAMAKSFYLLGQHKQAEKSFNRAKKLAPNGIQDGLYNKQLAELLQQI